MGAWLYSWFPQWWNNTYLAQIQSAFTVIGAALALLAVWYARRVANKQFKLMEDQDVLLTKQLGLIEEQTAADKRVAELTAELKVILARQGDIAETQQKIMQEQLAKKSELVMRSTGQDRNAKWSYREYQDYTLIKFDVFNYGSRGADGFYWELLFDDDWDHFVKLLDENDNEIEKKFTPLSEIERFKKAFGHYAHKLFPRSSVQVARIAVMTDAIAMQDFTIMWRIACEDEMIPEEGFLKISFKRHEDRFYAVEHYDDRRG